MRKFKINPEIVYDAIDGEVILLDIDKGNYYQLKNEAVQVWGAITSRKISSDVTVASSLAKTGEYSPNEILPSISPFIDQLESEHILLEMRSPKRMNVTSSSPKVNGKKSESKFPTPVLLKYTDMRSLLLLDPIHETGKSGWPNKKKRILSKM